jgi:hypothetical protein
MVSDNQVREEVQKMSDKPEGLIHSILDSYKKDNITVRIDKGNYVNKEVLIQVVGELRKILFPGYFDSNCVKGDYIEYIVGERTDGKPLMLNQDGCLIGDFGQWEIEIRQQGLHLVVPKGVRV